jgi:hypothetical protein
MAKVKKTIQVETVKKMVNHTLLHSPDDAKGERQGLCMLLEKILMDTGNYRGFNYLTKEKMKESEYGVSIGINSPAVELTIEKKFEGTDHTRVFYY